MKVKNARPTYGLRKVSGITTDPNELAIHATTKDYS